MDYQWLLDSGAINEIGEAFGAAFARGFLKTLTQQAGETPAPGTVIWINPNSQVIETIMGGGQSAIREAAERKREENLVQERKERAAETDEQMIAIGPEFHYGGKRYILRKKLYLLLTKTMTPDMRIIIEHPNPPADGMSTKANWLVSPGADPANIAAFNLINYFNWFQSSMGLQHELLLRVEDLPTETAGAV
jgi:hypothetical protein